MCLYIVRGAKYRFRYLFRTDEFCSDNESLLELEVGYNALSTSLPWLKNLKTLHLQ